LRPNRTLIVAHLLVSSSELTFWRSQARSARSCTVRRHTVLVQRGAKHLEHIADLKLRAADDERRQAKRNSLADKLTVEANALADLKIEKAAVDGERRTVDADLGPVRYLATLVGQADEVVLRWFVLVVALLLDPAAVLLLLAATRRQ
jgi:hypothetical protein